MDQLTPEALAEGLLSGTCPNCGGTKIYEEPSIKGGAWTFKRCPECDACAQIKKVTEVDQPRYGDEAFRAQWVKDIRNGKRHIIGANITRAALLPESMHGFTFEHCTFNGLDLSSHKIASSSFRFCNFRSTMLGGDGLEYVTFSNCGHSGTVIKPKSDGSAIPSVEFSSCETSHLVLDDASFVSLQLVNCTGYVSMRRTKVRRGTVYATGFANMDMRGAVLTDVNIGNPAEMMSAIRWNDADMRANFNGMPLRLACMLYDAAHHPHPNSFIEWVNGGGACPYGVASFSRALIFPEATNELRTYLRDHEALPETLPFNLMALFLALLEANGTTITALSEFEPADDEPEFDDYDEDEDEDED